MPPPDDQETEIHGHPERIDSLLPDEMALRAEAIGEKKAQLDLLRLFALAVLAGAFISFGAMFATVAAAGAEGVLPYGVTRVLVGVVFSLGLVLVIVGGAELFTGNALIVMGWAGGAGHCRCKRGPRVRPGVSPRRPVQCVGLSRGLAVAECPHDIWQDQGHRAADCRVRSWRFRAFHREHVLHAAGTVHQGRGQRRVLAVERGNAGRLSNARLGSFRTQSGASDHWQYYWWGRAGWRGVLVRLSART